MQHTQPAIVLVRPQMGENIGAAARAMLNFGLSDLRIVAPRDGWPNDAATDNAAGAFDVFTPTLHDTLADALKDVHFALATTARRRDMAKPAFLLAEAVAETAKRETTGQKIAFVFGPERTGLENDEVAQCHALLHIPTNAAFSSLNLGQSVLLVSYQYTSAKGGVENPVANPESLIPAPHADLQGLSDRLEMALEENGFFRDEGLKPTMKRNIRNMLGRANLTAQDIRTFHGMIASLAGNKKGR